jgi:hypothetical protein
MMPASLLGIVFLFMEQHIQLFVGSKVTKNVLRDKITQMIDLGSARLTHKFLKAHLTCSTCFGHLISTSGPKL